MDRRRRKRNLVLVVVALEVVTAVFAWRDLNRRSSGEIRGSRRLWRTAIVANPGNAVAYWFLGRRQA